MRFIGFDGTGHQTRDAMHPRDLAALLAAQIQTSRTGGRRVYTAGGGPANAMSLAQLNEWCDERFGCHTPEIDARPRPFDVPWVAMDRTVAAIDFHWRIETPLSAILEEIARHAVAHPEWLEVSGV
jgi:CDP-paratose 2-epimerase